MPTTESESPDRPLAFRVRFRGVLSASWFSTLQNVALHSTRVGNVTETTLEGEVPDEAALIGIVNMLYDLGCSLISVDCTTKSEKPDSWNELRA